MDKPTPHADPMHSPAQPVRLNLPVPARAEQGADVMVCLWQFCCRHDAFRRVPCQSDTILRWASIEACGLQC